MKDIVIVGYAGMPGDNPGVLTAIYNIAKENKCGCRIELKKIPVKESTILECDAKGINPYRLPTEAYVVLADSGYQAEQTYKAQGIMARCVGYLTEGNDKLIIDKSEPEYINKQ